jgi:hypothetical protein
MWIYSDMYIFIYLLASFSRSTTIFKLFVIVQVTVRRCITSLLYLDNLDISRDTLHSFMDPFELIDNDEHTQSISIYDDDCTIDDEINDVLLHRSMNRRRIELSPLRPIDLPSHRKHYGLLTFFNLRIPIIFRFEIYHGHMYHRMCIAFFSFLVYQTICMCPMFDFRLH